MIHIKDAIPVSQKKDFTHKRDSIEEDIDDFMSDKNKRSYKNDYQQRPNYQQNRYSNDNRGGYDQQRYFNKNNDNYRERKFNDSNKDNYYNKDLNNYNKYPKHDGGYQNNQRNFNTNYNKNYDNNRTPNNFGSYNNQQKFNKYDNSRNWTGRTNEDHMWDEKMKEAEDFFENEYDSKANKQLNYNNNNYYKGNDIGGGKNTYSKDSAYNHNNRAYYN